MLRYSCEVGWEIEVKEWYFGVGKENEGRGEVGEFLLVEEM